MKKVLPILLIIFSVSSIYAQVSISGDARVRPRYDIKDGGDYGNSQQDFYYMYRARINLKADIGDGWHFKTQLGHYGYGGYGFTTGLSTDNPLATAIEGSARPSVDFLQLYLGKETKDWGIIGGIIPINSVVQPIYDVHYYPFHMVDVPFFIRSVLGGFGFRAYKKVGEGKLTFLLLADKNESYTENSDGDVLNDKTDANTFALEYSFPISGFTLRPMVMYAVAPDNMMAPFTFGMDVMTPKVGKFAFSFSGIYSSQADQFEYAGTDRPEYSAWFFRAKTTGKVGPGTAVVWFDLAQRTDKPEVVDEIDESFSYLWLMYKIPVFNSEKGNVFIAPTIRYMTDSIDNVKDFSRYKIEITTNIAFN